MTNAGKHAPGARVSIEARGNPADGLHLWGRNPLGFSPKGTPGSGLGLVGRAERAALVGGTVDHGSHGGEFGLEVWLPWTPGPTPQRRRPGSRRRERLARDQLDALVLPLLLRCAAEVTASRRRSLRPGARRVGGTTLVGRLLVAGAAFTADRRALGQQGPAGAAVSRLVHQARPFFDDLDFFAAARWEERLRRIASARRSALARARELARSRLR